MSLSQNLASVALTFECPHCKRALVKNGSWFRIIAKYDCVGCGRVVRVTYPDKLALFMKYAHVEA